MERIRVLVEINPNKNRSKKNPDGPYPIYIMVRKGSKKAYIKPFNFDSIFTKDFSHGNYGNWIKKTHPKSKVYNNKLREILLEIDKFIDSHTKEIDINDIKEWYLRYYSSNRSSLKQSITKFSEYADEFTKKVSKRATKLAYESAMKKFNEFNPKISAYEIDKNVMREFSIYLKSECELSESSAKEYFNKVKTIYINWFKETYPDNPESYQRIFRGIVFKGTLSKEKKHLTKEELRKIIDLDLPKESKIEYVRDVFVFMCFTSRSFKEVKSLSFEKNFTYVGNDLSKPLIIGYRGKTGVSFRNPFISPIQKDIFEKYHPIKKGPFFPDINFGDVNPNGGLNDYLDKIRKLAGIDFRVSGRTARYTFNKVISKDLDQWTRADIMGHNNLQSQNDYNSKNDDIYSHIKIDVDEF